MNGLLLALLLAQVGPQNAGTVTGMVRGANGMPAAGVRVYAMTVRDAAEAASAGTALESIAQTDASGRYRLEVAAGRYYIASGSVGAPTYYPGTTNVAAARVVSIAAGGLVESIDFSSFVSAASRPTNAPTPIAPLPAGSTGVLGGVVRFPDGMPAAGMTVVAVPVAAMTRTGAVTSLMFSTNIVTSVGQPAVVTRRYVVNGYNIGQAVTDASGRFRIENVPPETYYVAAGFTDAPFFLPGTSDILLARTFVTTPTTRLDTLDFTVPREAVGVSVSGRVTALGGAPAAGGTVQILKSSPVTTSLVVAGLPTRNLSTSVAVRTDGSFEALHVLPGTYSVQASGMGVGAETRSITVADQAVSGLDFSIPVASVSGRILLEDGSAVPNPQLFADGIVTTVDNPNTIVSTIFPIASDGTFARLLEATTYRFYLRNLPNEYVIKSMTSGRQDLLKETLKLSSTEPTNIEIRVAVRTGPLSTNDVKLSGRVRDSFTGLPARAERVTLCCLASGPWERFSTPLRSDGSFEFAGVPRGRYEPGLQVGTGQPRLFVVAPQVEAGGGPTSGLAFLSTPQLGQLLATIVLENGSSFSASTLTSVVFTGKSGLARVVAQRTGDAVYLASVPAGDRYDVSVTNLPEGYTVKSISGSTEVPRATQANSFSGVQVPLPTAPILITLAPSAQQPPR